MGYPLTVAVDCYAGSRGEETPRRFSFENRLVEIRTVVEQWRTPDHRYFRVRTAWVRATRCEGYLWSAADILRGSIDSSDYKNYIFGLLFLKRLSDRFEEAAEKLIDELKLINNNARQAAITQEIAEIVGGAAAV